MIVLSHKDSGLSQTEFSGNKNTWFFSPDIWEKIFSKAHLAGEILEAEVYTASSC